MQQAVDRLKQALDDMRQAQQSAQQNPNSAEAQADARRAAERLAEAQRMMNGMRTQQAGSQLDDLADRADKLSQQQDDFAKRLEQAFGDARQPGRNGRATPGAAGQQQARQLADEKDKMAGQLDRLQKDMQQAARDLAGTQPAAASRVRDGLSNMQQTEVTNRTKASADRIRQGMGSFVVPTEKGVAQALDEVAKDLKAAQQALGQSAAQQGGQKGEMEQELARLERLRSQFQQMTSQGKDGQGKDGNQPGQQGGNQAGGNQPGQVSSARGRNGAYGGFGRFQPEGFYDVPDVQGTDPGSVARDAQLQLNDLKDQFKDNPDAQHEINDLNGQIQRMQMGSTASPELDARINREILPKLEALETRLRRQIDEAETGQVRSGSTDRVAPGYTDAVAEYFRKLSKGR